jgi:methionyl-tRNA synthetase
MLSAGGLLMYNKFMISIEDFKKVDIVVGKILSAEKIPETDKLLKLSVDMAEEKPRTIVSGISLYFPDCSLLVGKKCMFVANLEPRMIRGIESEGMILAVSGEEGKFSLLEPNDEIPAGTRAK